MSFRLLALLAISGLAVVAGGAWLADVLARISDHPASRLDQLLPWNWAAHSVPAEQAA